MNAYERRNSRRKEIKQNYRKVAEQSKLADRLVRSHLLMSRYEDIHKKVYGWVPEVDFLSGWYRVCGNVKKKFREKDFVHATDELYARQHEAQITKGVQDAT